MTGIKDGNQSRKMVNLRQHSKNESTSHEVIGIHHMKTTFVPRQWRKSHLAGDSQSSSSLLAGLFILLSLLEESLRDLNVLYRAKISLRQVFGLLKSK